MFLSAFTLKSSQRVVGSGYSEFAPLLLPVHLQDEGVTCCKHAQPSLGLGVEPSCVVTVGLFADNPTLLQQEPFKFALMHSDAALT